MSKAAERSGPLRSSKDSSELVRAREATGFGPVFQLQRTQHQRFRAMHHSLGSHPRGLRAFSIGPGSLKLQVLSDKQLYSFSRSKNGEIGFYWSRSLSAGFYLKVDHTVRLHGVVMKKRQC
jgi:hypothetical protein